MNNKKARMLLADSAGLTVSITADGICTSVEGFSGEITVSIGLSGHKVLHLERKSFSHNDDHDATGMNMPTDGYACVCKKETFEQWSKRCAKENKKDLNIIRFLDVCIVAILLTALLACVSALI